MNFFQRRKILKKANFLDLTPIRTMQEQIGDDGKVDILLPRFKSSYWREVYRKSRKGEFINIHLDETGSSIWKLIDGNRKVLEICTRLNETMPEKLQPAHETETRVTKFLSRLYQERYITFREIL
jgi:hypothetical protein